MNEKPLAIPTGGPLLAARKSIERGVRLLELIDTDSTGNREALGDKITHEPLAKNVDPSIDARLRDLKQRGRLANAIAVWSTEFGHTPFNNTAEKKGRDYRPPDEEDQVVKEVLA